MNRQRIRTIARSRLGMAALAGCTAALVLGTVAIASAPTAPAVIHACKGTNGALRIAKSCTSGEHALSWNKSGPQGKTGPAGQQGPKGDTGATG